MPIAQQHQADTVTKTRSAMEVVSGKLQASSCASNLVLTRGVYRLRLVQCREDLEAAFRLRFLVFNLELNEGLESAYQTGHDTDEFDKTCDHLIVEHRPSRQVVGTYRLQTGRVAGSNLGYYSEREFDFSPYEPIRNSLVELGRASIHRASSIIRGSYAALAGNCRVRHRKKSALSDRLLLFNIPVFAGRLRHV